MFPIKLESLSRFSAISRLAEKLESQFDTLTHRFRDDVVGVYDNGRAVGDEVCDGLHDVPWVLPPGETGE